MRGAYILIIFLEEDRVIEVGKLGRFLFPRGYYAYVGSAMKSIEKRVERHLRRDKKLKWHIDYLLLYGKAVFVFKIPSEEKIECRVAEKIENIGRVVVEKFGSTDCKCRSHLFYFSYDPKDDISNMLKDFTVYIQL